MATGQEALVKEIETLQMQDMLRLYNEMAEMCFNKCVTSFRSKELGKKENTCLELCVGKYMKNMTRCGMRFAEEQYLTQQLAQQSAQGMGQPPQ
jgi:mitochondrial import inner membrane translocase subunit TIM9